MLQLRYVIIAGLLCSRASLIFQSITCMPSQQYWSG